MLLPLALRPSGGALTSSPTVWARYVVRSPASAMATRWGGEFRECAGEFANALDGVTPIRSYRPGKIHPSLRYYPSSPEDTLSVVRVRPERRFLPTLPTQSLNNARIPTSSRWPPPNSRLWPGSSTYGLPGAGLALTRYSQHDGRSPPASCIWAAGFNGSCVV